MQDLLKSGSQDNAEYINLKVLGQDNAVVQFKIKKKTPLRKLMHAYCERQVSIYLFFYCLRNFL